MANTSIDVLTRHVLESNKIEDIHDMSGPLFEGHLEAAKLAAQPQLIHPLDLHRMLARNVPEMQWHAGSYRGVRVWVGPREMPQPYMVPILMQDWDDMVAEYMGYNEASGYVPFAAFFVHCWLLCIHPFVDGNGRTARLVWNNLRIVRGLDWHVQEASDKLHYYAQIEHYENKVFLPWLTSH